MVAVIFFESRICPAVRPSRLSNGALTAMQRSRRRNSTTAPLLTNKALTAEKKELFLTKNASKNQQILPFLKCYKALPGMINRRNAYITMGFSDTKAP